MSENQKCAKIMSCARIVFTYRMNKLSFITFPSISRLFIHTNIYSFVFELFFIWSYKPLSAIFFSKKRVFKLDYNVDWCLPELTLSNVL